MSKIHTEFKLKDLYAIKHSLEKNIKENSDKLNLVFMSTEEGIDNLKQQLEKDISHEKGIVNYLVEIISKYKKTEEYYSKEINIGKPVRIIDGIHKGKSGQIIYEGTGWHSGIYTVFIEDDISEIIVNCFEIENKLCMDCDYFKEGCIQCEKGIQMACGNFKDNN